MPSGWSLWPLLVVAQPSTLSAAAPASALTPSEVPLERTPAVRPAARVLLGNASQASFEYEKLYETIDKKANYHNPNFALETSLVPFASRWMRLRGAKLPAPRRVISLGCSTGLGVYTLAKVGLDAYGVDVSSISVATAHELKRDTMCKYPPCIQQASLVSLPFPSGYFVAGLSADVLEHIKPSDVPLVAAEISRVVQNALFLRIASIPEVNKVYVDGQLQRLHLTTEGVKWWYKTFAVHGWRKMSSSLWVGMRESFPASNEATAYLALQRKSKTSPRRRSPTGQ